MNQTEQASSAHVLKKTRLEEFDLVILGGGTGSTLAAWTFAGEGKRVAVVDRKYIGGSCPNIACLPNIIHCAKVALYFRRSEEFGITHDGFAIDMSGVRERKRRMVRDLNDMYMENYRNTGAEFILGVGRFLAPRTVEVTLADGTTRQLWGENVIVSTGMSAALETVPGLAEAQPLTHIEALELDEIPEHLLGNRVTTGRQVPYCLFTDPELAHIGLSETEVEAHGVAYRLFKVPMETNLRARTLSETRVREGPRGG
jgi:pyruvate/2-oxoglutarate dehydrogenase complex dihydrolipoamide dehydrogenase (E3) component